MPIRMNFSSTWNFLMPGFGCHPIQFFCADDYTCTAMTVAI
jgi:hypothetical protein